MKNLNSFALCIFLFTTPTVWAKNKPKKLGLHIVSAPIQNKKNKTDQKKQCIESCLATFEKPGAQMKACLTKCE